MITAVRTHWPLAWDGLCVPGLCVAAGPQVPIRSESLAHLESLATSGNAQVEDEEEEEDDEREGAESPP